jgi:hypothetical protein
MVFFGPPYSQRRGSALGGAVVDRVRGQLGGITGHW